MRKPTKLTTAILLAASVNVSYGGENCLPPNAGLENPMKVLKCFQRVLDKQEQQIQRQQAEIQALSLSDGLMAHYPFDGNANDVSGHGNHGTVNGATLTTDRFGKANSAYKFDGADDYLDMKDSPHVQNLVFGHGTFLVWFKTHATEWGDIVGYYDAGDGEDGFLLRYQANGEINFILGDSSGNNEAYSLAKHNLGDDKWHHVASVWDGKKMFLYVDGNLIGSKPYVVMSKYHWKPDRLTVGAHPNAPSIGIFKGKIDDIRIYNRALTEVEIQSLYKLSTTD